MLGPLFNLAPSLGGLHIVSLAGQLQHHTTCLCRFSIGDDGDIHEHDPLSRVALLMLLSSKDDWIYGVVFVLANF